MIGWPRSEPAVYTHEMENGLAFVVLCEEVLGEDAGWVLIDTAVTETGQ